MAVLKGFMSTFVAILTCYRLLCGLFCVKESLRISISFDPFSRIINF